MFDSLLAKYPRWIQTVPWAGLTLLFLSGLLGDQGIFRLRELGEERIKLETAIQHETEINLTLRREVHLLRTDDRMLEKLAREELGLAREGEIIYHFQDPAPAGEGGAQVPPTSAGSGTKSTTSPAAGSTSQSTASGSSPVSSATVSSAAVSSAAGPSGTASSATASSATSDRPATATQTSTSGGTGSSTRPSSPGKNSPSENSPGEKPTAATEKRSGSSSASTVEAPKVPRQP